ncbi:L-threonine aldolase [Pacificibacter maritimus]|uniref:L-threonine aldolase n=1 Tax=Pacificibacter maritimus TaxID=762213 RepID=A0A3N4U7K7_9RHOB|nr:beta-eliminating lyase-related protein [Pacificibacter maritimus]RPE66422.1 L-threonine aldolase [Pacificibacter maritimus]
MFFASDNTSGVHPKIMEALVKANEGFAPAYGADKITDALQERLRDLFDAPDARIYPMTSGTGANAALLAAMTPPWGVIYCHETAHIEVDERGAATFFAGGAKLKALPSTDSRLDAVTLAKITTQDRGNTDVHGMPPVAVSMTNLTEFGETYSPAQIAEIASASALPIHMDGARFANAMAKTGATAWEMTRELSTLSLGATKTGAMAAEAAVIFDPALIPAFESHRMRGGHNLSKARFVSAQILAWLEDDLWLELATRANEMAQLLAQGITERGGVLNYSVDGNMIFASLPRATHARAKSKGAAYHLWGADTALAGAPDTSLMARFVTSWSTTQADVDALLKAFDP